MSVSGATLLKFSRALSSRLAISCPTKQRTSRAKRRARSSRSHSSSQSSARPSTESSADRQSHPSAVCGDGCWPTADDRWCHCPGTLLALYAVDSASRPHVDNAPIPAFVNPNSGTGDAARSALEEAGGFDVEQCDPKTLDREIDRVVSAGADRIVVAGGDGTVAKAASSLVGTKAALAVVPGGTLNHFARDHGIPTDPREAVELSSAGKTTTTDVAYVNGRLFLNTSSVGAYVLFVRTRERLERYVGYRLATILAAFRLLGRIRPFTVELELDGVA